MLVSSVFLSLYTSTTSVLVVDSGWVKAFLSYLRNGATEAVEYSANKICYVRKIGEEGFTPVDCSKKAPRYHLCRYRSVDEWGPISAIPMDSNGDFELLVELDTGNDIILPLREDFLGAKKRCEARGRELLTIENSEKGEIVASVINNFQSK